MSTPDDPFAGGRVLDLQPIGVQFSGPDLLIKSFQRQVHGVPDMWGDPAWTVRLATPEALSPGTEYPVDGSASDVLRLSDDYRLQSTFCPELTGNVAIHDVATDGDGLATLVTATFVVHCTPDDTLYGALGIGAPAPPLPEGAQSVIDRESRFPHIDSVFDGESANTIEIDVHRRSLLIRWDTPTGFTCVDAVVEEQPEGTVSGYSGRDDTMRVGALDPTKRYTATYSLGTDSANCQPEAESFLSVVPLHVSLDTPTRSAGTGNPVVFHGRVDTRFEDYTEWAPFVDVILKGRKPNGSVIELGTTATDRNGRYSLTTDVRQSLRVYAVVRPGHIAKDPELPRAPAAGTFYHFADRSKPLRTSALG